MYMKKVYIAGPDVFLPDAVAHGKKLKRITKENGFEGLFPLDNEIKGDDPAELAEKIKVANINMIRNCDAVVANLLPFRGPEPDSGTVWEVGFAQALGKVVIGYCSDVRSLKQKTIETLNLDSTAVQDAEGFEIEDFGLTHNLMFADIVTCNSFEEAISRLKFMLS
ncbi:MAG: nucleoside 2-deoxyribosyltransferase [Denitrovibrio sp.]|nr:MAG: nucleoside 2-deoxyribosyltransferase [Denitrovibrio sp.]